MILGVDTRLGLGYRLGQNADAQVMMEIGPQLFTEPLPNEHRPRDGPSAQQQPLQIRDVRQPTTQQVQQLLQEELEKQKQLQRRQQLPFLTKEEIQHQRIGELLHASASQNPAYHRFLRPQFNSPEQMQPPSPPRQRQMFSHRPNFPNQYHQPPAPMFNTPINNHYMNMPPPTVLQVRNNPRPSNSNSHNNNNNYVRNINPTMEPVSKPKTTTTNPQSESDPYVMYTAYEKWLLKQGASAQGHGPSSTVVRRNLPFNNENNREVSSAPLITHNNIKLAPKSQFSFHGAREASNVSSTVNSNSKKIVRMTQKRPATLKPESFGNRVGNNNYPRPYYHNPPPMPPFQRPHSMPPFRHYQQGPSPQNLRYPMPPMRRSYPVPQRFGYNNMPPIRRAQYTPQRMNYPIHSHPQPPQPQPTFSTLSRSADIEPIPSSYSPWQNFVMEADDSFLRRNAQSQIQNEKLASIGSPGLQQQTMNEPVSNRREEVLEESAIKTAVKTGANVLGAIKDVIRPVKKYFQPTVEPPRKYNDREFGDYFTTTEPLLIATPTPTPVPSLYEHMGRKNPNLPDQTPREQASAVVHIGEELSYKDLASSLQISPSKGRNRKNRPKNKKPSKPKDNDEAESVVEAQTDEPINPPGVEMFIDIESGELSVRKPIASLAHFGDVTTTTSTTPEPKTEDEIEDAESGKIFERLQEHFKESYENFQVTQAVKESMKERKEKIKKEQDESLGLINRYFDLLGDNQDEEIVVNRRRKRLDSVLST